MNSETVAGVLGAIIAAVALVVASSTARSVNGKPAAQVKRRSPPQPVAATPPVGGRW